MEISCRLVKVEDDVFPSVTNLKKGQYLLIEIYGNESVFVSHEEFNSVYNAAEQEVGILLDDIGVSIDLAIVSVDESREKPRFEKVINFLKQKIDISEDDFRGDEDELIVRSDWGVFIELPWESIVNKDIFVIREIILEKQKNLNVKENNLLLIASHAEKHEGNSLNPIKEKLDEEVYALINSIKENDTPTRFKLQSMYLSIHTTEKSLRLIPWSRYNYGHFIMHGLDTGELCLEKSDNHKQVDPIAISDLLQILGSHSFSLLFFSFCYSGGGVKNSESLSFQIVRKGISKYAIGYSYPVGGESASMFAKYFYNNLLNGDKDELGEDKLRIIYKASLKEYYKRKGQTEYIPLLYAYK